MDNLTPEDKRLIDYALAFMAANVDDAMEDDLDLNESDIIEQIRHTKAKVQ
jgi:hypothetical protein